MLNDFVSLPNFNFQNWDQLSRDIKLLQAETPQQGGGPGEQGAERAVEAVLAQEDVAGREDILGSYGIPGPGEEGYGGRKRVQQVRES